MKTVIIDVKQLTKDLVAKDAEVQTCAKKLADACKGKKAGDTVKVDGKDAKCK